MAKKAYLLLGSNLGNRKEFLDNAIDLLEENGIKIEKQSAVYESPPWGIEEQPGFLNQVIAVSTTLAPVELLSTVKNIEKDLGRKERERWGPREIDIDILIFEGVEMSSKQLTLPHPGIKDRSFTLVPLAEIGQEELVDGKKISELLRLRHDAGQIVKWHE